MAIQCLRAGLPEVLKANLMGSLHWCLLLVLGQSIFMAGFKKKMLEFNQNGAAAQMSCQVVASISITLPTLYGSVAGVSPEDVLLLSRVCALFLIFLYLSFIYFHLKTHKAGGNKRPVSQAFRGARRKAIFRAMRVPAK
ncbi:unnamed protein product [Durusdinium trenchii]|uniref:Very-long-chain 3-oxoacyl-CoA synthase n=1 Tax=Durusdinium trenchii TaxID=1381693 RepID=A0ABP0RUG6_9DINO